VPKPPVFDCERNYIDNQKGFFGQKMVQNEANLEQNRSHFRAKTSEKRVPGNFFQLKWGRFGLKIQNHKVVEYK
jgi:hypothetical protein